MSNKLSDELIEGNEEDSDEEDVDYHPENDVLSGQSFRPFFVTNFIDCSEQSGSELDEEEGEDNASHKRKKGNHKNTTEEEVVKVEEELTEEQHKQKSDSLWDEFCKDLPKTNETKGLSTIGTNNEINERTGISDVKPTVTKIYDFAGQEVCVTEEVEANTSKGSDKSNGSQSDSKPNVCPSKPVKRTSGLGSLINELSKKPKLSTLSKSFIDWNNYKKVEGIEDELKQHNKSRDTFTERQAFLQRTDLRQFEIEKQIREKNRSQRELSKD